MPQDPMSIVAGAYATGGIGSSTRAATRTRITNTVNLGEAAAMLGISRRALNRLREERPSLLPTIGEPPRQGVAGTIARATVKKAAAQLAREAKERKRTERAITRTTRI